jgi:hypothetical protein
VEIPARVWHSIIVLESNSVLFEVKDGPYEALTDKNFAQWAPPEGDAHCDKFNENVLESISLFK